MSPAHNTGSMCVCMYVCDCPSSLKPVMSASSSLLHYTDNHLVFPVRSIKPPLPSPLSTCLPTLSAETKKDARCSPVTIPGSTQPVSIQTSRLGTLSYGTIFKKSDLILLMHYLKFLFLSLILIFCLYTSHTS